VSYSCVYILSARLTTVNHQSVNKLHSFSSLSSELARDDNFASLGSALHNESEHTIAGSPDSQTSEKLVSQRFTLSNGTKTTVVHLLSIQLNGTFWEVESLLYYCSQLSNPSSFLTKNTLCSGG